MSEINNNYNENEELDIDLMGIFGMLVKKWKILTIAMILGGAMGFGITKYLMTPVYSASSIVYVFTQTTSITSVSDLQFGTQLAQDFEILATSRPVLENVIEELNLNTSYEVLKTQVNVANLDDSRMIKITVKNHDAQLAADISNSLANAMRTRVVEVMDADKPTMVEEAIPSLYPISPNARNNVVIGAMFVLILVAGVHALNFILDDTIKTSKDISKYLKAQTLAEIPVNLESNDDKKRKLSRKSKK